MALGLILLASVLAQAAQGSPLPGNPVLHLQPASLPVAGSAVSTWQNTASANPTIPDAVLDNTNCYQSGGVCSSPPSVVAVTNELNAVAFQSPGWIGLGNNLVVSADFSSPDTPFSLFFVGQVQSQRILGSRNSNWVLGSWYDGNAKTTFVDRAYANSAAGDGGWIAQGRTPANGTQWAVWGITIAGSGGASTGGCAWRGPTVIGCNPLALGPNVLRLGGGNGADSSTRATEFGTGAILELVAWQAELTPQDVWGVVDYFQVRYPQLLN